MGDEYFLVYIFLRYHNTSIRLLSETYVLNTENDTALYFAI